MGWAAARKRAGLDDAHVAGGALEAGCPGAVGLGAVVAEHGCVGLGAGPSVAVGGYTSALGQVMAYWGRKRIVGAGQ